MSPSGKDNGNRDNHRAENLDSAVRKVEEKSGKEDNSVGGQIRRGWKENA